MCAIADMKIVEIEFNASPFSAKFSSCTIVLLLILVDFEIPCVITVNTQNTQTLSCAT